MLNLIKRFLTTVFIIAIVSFGYTFYSLNSFANDGMQNIEVWNKVIDNQGSVTLLGRINTDHRSRETKIAKLKQYTIDNQDLFKAIFIIPEEKRDLPILYKSDIEKKKQELSQFQFSKTLKFNKTNNIVKLKINSKDELSKLVNQNILYDLVEPHIHYTDTGISSVDVSSQLAWTRDQSDVSFPDIGPKQTGENQLIAILDTGIENQHPYLLQKVKYEACFQDHEIDDEENCSNGDTGKDSGLPCNEKYSGCFHGTFMAGIATGNGDNLKNPNNGIAKNADIFSLQVFSIKKNERAQTTEAEFSQALDLVHVYNILRKILKLIPLPPFELQQMASVNLSFGSGLFTSSCDGASVLSDIQTDIWELRYTYGVPTVISAGNGINTSSIGGNGVASPSCLSDAFTIGATTNGLASNTTLTNFSNGANGLIDISAPGDLTYSSILKSRFTPNQGILGGTSGAAAHVSGAFALINQVFPNDNFTLEDKFKVLNDVATPFNYTTFAGIIRSPIPPFNQIGFGPIAGNSKRLLLCKDYERTGVGEAGVDAPFNIGTWNCKSPPQLEAPKNPPFNSDWFKPFKIKCEYCPKYKK
jgi:subtilisin family serine protease